MSAWPCLPAWPLLNKTGPPFSPSLWLPDGYSQNFRSYVFGPSGHLDYGSASRYAALQNLRPPPPPWRNSRKGRAQILPSGNLVCIVSLVSRLTIRIQAQAIESGGCRSLVGQITEVEHRFADSSAPLVDAVVSTSILAFVV